MQKPTFRSFKQVTVAGRTTLTSTTRETRAASALRIVETRESGSDRVQIRMVRGMGRHLEVLHDKPYHIAEAKEVTGYLVFHHFHKAKIEQVHAAKCGCSATR